jgi:hypothetical protein
MIGGIRVSGNIAETRKIAYETWRFQVDSYWSRNSYFAAFETVAVAGVWTLAEKVHHWTALCFALLCVALTLIWFKGNERVHEYISFWWEMAIKSDTLVSTESEQFGLASRFEGWRKSKSKSHGFAYSRLIQGIPVLFFAGWLYLIVYNIKQGIRYL